MRISDWSSDVCSSDLPSAEHLSRTETHDPPAHAGGSFFGLLRTKNEPLGFPAIRGRAAVSLQFEDTEKPLIFAVFRAGRPFACQPPLFLPDQIFTVDRAPIKPLQHSFRRTNLQRNKTARRRSESATLKGVRRGENRLPSTWPRRSGRQSRGCSREPYASQWGSFRDRDRRGRSCR